MFRFSISLLLFLAFIYTSYAQEKTWKAGVAKTPITPTEPMWMSGYSSRTKPAEGKVHDLWAKALVLQAADGKKCVLISLDLIGLSRDLGREIARRLEKDHGYPRDAICFAASHTHCGPIVRDNLDAMYFLDDVHRKRVRDYGERLIREVAEVVARAEKDLAPALVTHGQGLATFATNRRNNKEGDVESLRLKGKLVGPIDHDVPVLAIRSPEGSLRAIVFGYACHATVLSFYQWCGDYPGFAQTALEERYPGAIALFFAGCGADQNPLPRRTVDLAEKYGKELASSAAAVLDAPMKPVEAMVRAQYREIDLPLADLPSREQLVKDAEDINKYVAARAKMLLETLAKAGSLKATYPYPVQTWRLGKDLTVAALGGEVVVDYSLRLKKELGPMWTMGYANDVMAYIPSKRVLQEGGYEGASSMIYYGLPTVWSPRLENMIVDEVRRQVELAK